MVGISLRSLKWTSRDSRDSQSRDKFWSKFYKSFDEVFDGKWIVSKEEYSASFGMQSKANLETQALTALACLAEDFVLQEIDLKNHKWGHYIICGYKVPIESRLLSSSAFVCSSTIAITASIGVNMAKKGSGCFCYGTIWWNESGHFCYALPPLL
ncbi:hypothetical protein CQW23_34448 [Capsicum baccatum]|uniref:Uncharacterized protein n=1 Tax=Capsicum baccatum TaxID=33114 RepID=A0A2G2UYZ9_CAPBA|nr:hypothetical protein CQW23_34448 [Capsicum baccatum]